MIATATSRALAYIEAAGETGEDVGLGVNDDDGTMFCVYMHGSVMTPVKRLPGRIFAPVRASIVHSIVCSSPMSPVKELSIISRKRSSGSCPSSVGRSPVKLLPWRFL